MFCQKKPTVYLKCLQQNRENDMLVHGVKRSFGNFEKYWFPSLLDEKIFLFMFMFKSEDLW